MSFFGQTIVILNKQSDAVNLLEKRGGVYSGRPVLLMGGILSGWDSGLSSSNGTRARNLRRIMHSAMGTAGHMAQLAPMEEDAVHDFLRRVMANPNNLREEIRR